MSELLHEDGYTATTVSNGKDMLDTLHVGPVIS